MDTQQIENFITMIGCNRKEFMDIIGNNQEKVSMSSGSWHSPYWILIENELVAIYDTKGNLKYNK